MMSYLPRSALSLLLIVGAFAAIFASGAPETRAPPSPFWGTKFAATTFGFSFDDITQELDVKTTPPDNPSTTGAKDPSKQELPPDFDVGASGILGCKKSKQPSRKTLAFIQQKQFREQCETNDLAQERAMCCRMTDCLW
mmetsp:Transcript_24921/g.40387  ORF Transcript_24921/g.40387 Transcript_24921/m.40387 type:complete len:139 (+) Transcript_24921:138-554(+)